MGLNNYYSAIFGHNYSINSVSVLRLDDRRDKKFKRRYIIVKNFGAKARPYVKEDVRGKFCFKCRSYIEN